MPRAATAPLRRPGDIELGFRRLEDLRLTLRRRGYEEKVVSSAVQAWAPSTNKNYDSNWKAWVAFASGRGADPTAANYPLLSEWLASKVEHGTKQGSFEGAKTVVSDFWSIVDNPATLINKLKQAAAKLNGGKNKKLSRSWNLFYLHDYVHDIKVDDMDFHELTMNVCVKMRGALGWRSADLTGISIEHSFQWRSAPAEQADSAPTHNDGVFIRAWSIKQKQGSWSQSTWVPRLNQQFKDLCMVYAVELLINKIKDFDAAQRPSVEMDGQATTPLFCYVKKVRQAAGDDPVPTLFALRENTIANYFKKYFLDQVADAGYAENNLLDANSSIKLSAQYDAHSCRNAVASLLAAEHVPTVDIAGHMLCSADNLTSTYISPIVDPSDYPAACLAAHSALALKLLVPFIHHKSKDDATNTCKCSELTSKASSEEHGV